MRWFRADLHVHTVLSPCAAVEMTPRNIIRHAQAAGIDIVAITDHNAGDNVAAALRAAAGTGVAVLPGMELQTREEVHLLALFGRMRDFMKWCGFVASHRSPLLNDEARFGPQFVVKDDGLAGGKGVVVTPDRAAARAHVDAVLAAGAESGIGQVEGGRR